MTNLEWAVQSTLDNDGGTFNAETYRMVLRSSGYAVAIEDTLTVPADDRRAIEVAIEVMARMGRGPFIGTWVKDGTVYVDSVVILPDRASALIVGRAFRQQAIYDFATQTAIEVK